MPIGADGPWAGLRRDIEVKAPKLALTSNVNLRPTREGAASLENLWADSGETVMQIGAALLFLAWAAVAQNPASGTATASGCGPDDIKFAVSTEGKHPASRPEAGKALPYLIEDDRYFQSRPRPTTRWGVDGTWVRTTHANSYFYVVIGPGEHHLCAKWQFTAVVGQGHEAAARHFIAEAGGVYYFRVANS